MWFLVFIVLVPNVAGIDKVTKLEHYDLWGTCDSERQRIMIEMEKQYPNDPTWTLECRFYGTRT